MMSLRPAFVLLANARFTFHRAPTYFTCRAVSYFSCTLSTLGDAGLAHGQPIRPTTARTPCVESPNLRVKTSWGWGDMPLTDPFLHLLKQLDPWHLSIVGRNGKQLRTRLTESDLGHF